MKSNFYGNRKSLLAVFICAAFLSGSHVAYAVMNRYWFLRTSSLVRLKEP